jgi:long-subunit acyl-CoA synthetase (AMP-forming)
LLGKPVAGITIKIFPARNAPYPSNSHELNVLDKNEVGEICVSGGVVTDGYYRMPGATFDARFDFEGKVFHRMGDLGYFDQDDNLRFMGRKIECIPTPNGPLETERCEPIVNAYDGIYRSALVGIGLGALREPCLVVEPANKSSKRVDLEKNIRKDLRKRMPAFAVERIFWENSIPVDSRHNAKIHRLALSRKWTRLVAQKPKLGLPG